MTDATRLQNDLCNKAFAAEGRGNYEDAGRLFAKALRCVPRNPVPYLFLGHVLYELQRVDAALAVYSLGADLDSRILTIEGSSDAVLGTRSTLANRRLRRHFRRLHDEAMQALETAIRVDCGRIRDAIWVQTHDRAFEFLTDQRPQLFYVPDLTGIPFYTTEDLPWMQTLQAGAEAVLADYQRLIDRNIDAEHYLGNTAPLDAAWTALSQDLNWATFRLYESGRPNQVLLDETRATVELLSGIPLAGVTRTAHEPREVVFSMLQSGQHIPAHYGLANCGLTVHLPLITEGDAGIKVDGQSRQWACNEAVAFDDSFLHESWNRGPRARVNLLFEAWHPDLSDGEKLAIEAAYAVRREWTAARKLP